MTTTGDYSVFLSQIQTFCAFVLCFRSFAILGIYSNRSTDLQPSRLHHKIRFFSSRKRRRATMFSSFIPHDYVESQASSPIATLKKKASCGIAKSSPKKTKHAILSYPLP